MGDTTPRDRATAGAVATVWIVLLTAVFFQDVLVVGAAAAFGCLLTAVFSVTG